MVAEGGGLAMYSKRRLHTQLWQQCYFQLKCGPGKRDALARHMRAGEGAAAAAAQHAQQAAGAPCRTPSPAVNWSPQRPDCCQRQARQAVKPCANVTTLSAEPKLRCCRLAEG